MKLIFESNHIDLLKKLSTEKVLYAFDFDGTLAPIVPHPKDATISNMTMGYLKQLNDIVPVAIISGRSLSDIESKFPFRPKYLVGNHGLEGTGPNQRDLSAAQALCARWKTLLEKQLYDVKKLSGVEIEDKLYSIAVHYRHANDKASAKLEILNAVASLEIPARVIAGKSVINILPPGATHKGDALLEILARESLTKAVYIGDDDTDEDIFELPHDNVLSIRVGERADSQAQYYMRTQNDINKLLRVLIDYNRLAYRRQSPNA